MANGGRKLGNLRLLVLAALIIALGAGLGLAMPTAERAHALSDRTCTGGAASADKALSIPEAQLDCGNARFDRRDRFVIARIYPSRTADLPRGELILRTDPASFDTMVVSFTYADGTTADVDVDRRMTVRNWDAGGSFWIPVPKPGSQVTGIAMLVERPRSPAIFERLELVGFDAAARTNYAHTLLYVLVCGILLVPAIYDLLFYRVLGARFMVWHVVLSLGTLAFVVFNSGLIILLYPGLSPGPRFWGIYLAISTVMVAGARFSLLILEEGVIPPRLEQWWLGSALFNLLVAFVIALDLEGLRIAILDFYLVSILPVIGLTIAAIIVAMARGSRIVGFLAIAYTGLLAAGSAQSYSSLFGRFYATEFDQMLYLALVLLVVGTSAAVGDRFVALKADRDRAQLRAVQLDAMANSDGLTGLLNRRAFDQHRRLPEGRALLLVDLDRFKTINDTFGHQRGDAVLVHAADILRRAANEKGQCQIYRLGGEEFAILCTADSDQDVADAAECLRAAIEIGGPERRRDEMPPITVSVGAVLGHGQLMHVAFSEADQALYRAKSEGRNRYSLAGQATRKI